MLRQRGDGELIGYVQATVQADGRALVAYELASRHWGQGLGSEAVQAMLDELQGPWQVRQALAVFKRANLRSIALLLRLGFADAHRRRRGPRHARAGRAVDESPAGQLSGRAGQRQQSSRCGRLSQTSHH